MRRFFAVAGIVLAALLVAWIAANLGNLSGAVPPHQVAACPTCGRPAVFDGPDRSIAPADWSWFDCDHCVIRFIRYDDGRTSVLGGGETMPR